MLGSAPVDLWYDKIVSYDFDKPVPGINETGHFTHVVWKSSTQLGMAIALTSDNHTAHVVANYYPRGNIQGKYAANVLPPCWDNVGGD